MRSLGFFLSSLTQAQHHGASLPGWSRGSSPGAGSPAPPTRLPLSQQVWGLPCSTPGTEQRPQLRPALPTTPAPPSPHSRVTPRTHPALCRLHVAGLWGTGASRGCFQVRTGGLCTPLHAASVLPRRRPAAHVPAELQRAGGRVRSLGHSIRRWRLRGS